MTISEAIDYIEDINSTVSWTKEQETDREFFENVAEWLEELKVLRKKAKGDKWYQQGRADTLTELWNIAISKYDEILSLEELAECIDEVKGE